MSTRRLNPEELNVLVSRAVAGEKGAFARLDAQYRPLARATARRCGAGSDCEDLVQEALLRLHLHLADLRQPSALPAWLCRTVRNLCFSRARRQSRLHFASLDLEDSADTVAATSSDPCADEVVAWEEAEAVRRAVARLSARDRNLALHLMAETAYGEISTHLSMPVGSIGPTRERMLRRLAGTAEIRHLVDAA
jgi:RNA polymerase sigma factor (sigma-70 family)